MANVPYDHIVAPAAVKIGGALAFQKDDPIPVATADRYGIAYAEDDVVAGVTGPDRSGFSDVAIVVQPAQPVEPDEATVQATGTDSRTANPAPAAAAKAKAGSRNPSTEGA